MGALFTIFLLAETWKQFEPWLWPATHCTILSLGGHRHRRRRGPLPAPGSLPVRSRRPDPRKRPVLPQRRRHRQLRPRPRPRSAVPARRRGKLQGEPEPSEPCGPRAEHPVDRVGRLLSAHLRCHRRRRPLGHLDRLPVGERSGGRVDLAEGEHRDGATKCMVGFGLIFVAVGAAVFVPMTLVPSIRLAESMTWEAIPCTIVGSSIRSWSTDDGTSYRADVHYEYRAGGREWRSNRVDFFSFLSSGRSDARAIRDRHPNGSSTTCWVDPGDPSRSVLERAFPIQTPARTHPADLRFRRGGVGEARPEVDAERTVIRRSRHRGGRRRDPCS